MSEPMLFSNDHEQVLVQFQQDQEQAADPVAVLHQYIHDHPELERRLRHLAAMPRMLHHLTIEPEPPMPAKLGEFRVLRRLDGGGMGEIYLAKHDRLDRMVAIKVIRRGRISPDARRRFLREQQVLAHLHQTHIVPIFTAGEVDELQYFVMPYINGVALDKVLSAARSGDPSGTSGHVSSLRELASNLIPKESTPPQPKNNSDPDASIPTRPDCTTPAEAQSHRPACAPAEKQLVLSLAYFRSVAETMADAAEALHRVHTAGVVHRDLKPANLMLEADGNSWVIDFGLAGFLNGQSTDGTRIRVTRAEPEALTTTGILGKPPYMSPEQWNGQSSVLTDLWSLGATLYELLTLHQAFPGATLADVQTAVVAANPVSPHTHVRNMPADLSAICLKALKKESGQRYRTAQEFADDLRRWLRYEPTVARPARVPRRLFMWSRRNPGWAAFIITFGLLIGAIAVWQYEKQVGANDKLKMANAELEVSEARAAAGLEKLKGTKAELAAAEARANLERERGLAKQREFLLVQQAMIRLVSHRIEWSKEAINLAVEAAGNSGEKRFRDHVAANLLGLDAQIEKNFEEFSAYSLVFDPESKGLLLGGMSYKRPGKEHKIFPARLWDGTHREPTVSKQIGDGPAVFQRDGTPIQIACKKRWSFDVWDMAKQGLLRELTIAGKEGVQLAEREGPPIMALSSDGSFFASSPNPPAGETLPDKENIAVWDVASGKLLRQYIGSATSLVFTPPAQGKKPLLAAGTKDGRVLVWSLPDGEKLADFPTGDLAVQALAFRRDPRRSREKQDKRDELHGWQLATGHAGGAINIWNLDGQRLRTRCHGAHYDAFALAFSPDGMTLASGGRDCKLWDVATGRLLLDLDRQGYLTSLAFSPDGKKLAASALPFFGPGGTRVYDLEPGRGQYYLRGLTAPVSRVTFSRNGKLIAGLSDNWDLAVWERESRRLLHVFETPPGFFADNAAIAFNADATQLAFSSGEHAVLWDLATGEELRRWTLPPALGDLLAFLPGGKLHLFRWETADFLPPFGEVDWKAHPRVCRLRNLLGPKPQEPIKEITDFSGHVYMTRVAPDGCCFVAEGVRKDRNQRLDRSIQAFDALTGNSLWRIKSNRTANGGSFEIDSSGNILATTLEEGPTGVLVELKTGKLLGTRNPLPGYLGPGLETWCNNLNDGLHIYRRDDKTPILTLGIDSGASCAQFDATGRYLLRNDRDANVILADLQELQTQLAKVGLGW